MDRHIETFQRFGGRSHKAMSNLIQGGVAEIVRVAISRLHPAMADIGANMLMQVHDSIIFEIPENQINVALPTIERIMSDFDFDPKPGVDIDYGYSWGLFQKWDGERVDPSVLPRP